MASKVPETRESLEWSANRIRDAFINYFAKNNHTLIPSGPVVPLNDATLLFTNSGMVQYKAIFQGTATGKFSKLKRAANSQKCIRAGGKHNDLDDVGKDGYHHTLFEMLGNWSFGDYFKEDAIPLAWNFLTTVCQLDPDRLYVTYFEGDEAGGLEPDLEAKGLWLKAGVAEDHIIPGNTKDNFWEMGESGPCGPCSEIHYDRIGERNAAALVNQDDPAVLEIWNIVFMQYDRQVSDRSLKPLPNKHIDTGMGFERLVSVLQDKASNYDTDVFWPLFSKVQQVTGIREYTDLYGKDDKDGIDTAYRVVADHIRMLSFAICDGASPDNTGVGYVVRRVLRRGTRYANKYLIPDTEEDNIKGRFFSSIYPALVEQMGAAFPELRHKQAEVCAILDVEEQSFLKTLGKGEKIFSAEVAKLKASGSTSLSADFVWKLFGTYGYPIDLTQLMAEEMGLSIDTEELKKVEAAAIAISKSEKTTKDLFDQLDTQLVAELKEGRVAVTDDTAKFSKTTDTAKVLFVFFGKEFLQTSEDVPQGAKFGVILDRTNFYAEQGGQVCDTGKITRDGVAAFDVMDVRTTAAYVLHNGVLTSGVLRAGDEVVCSIDASRRTPIESNHTGTHVLNHALREVLQGELQQRGSKVDEEELRFDFAHGTGAKLDDLKKIEHIANSNISKDLEVFIKEVELNLAYKIKGVRAVFGETYPDPVRVVSVGVDIDTLIANPENEEWTDYSIEFCGGTHVKKTAGMKQLVVISEGAISTGTRRVVAYTGEAAIRAQNDAQVINSRIDQLEIMEFSEDKLKATTTLTTDVGKAFIPAISKHDISKRIARISAENLALQKKAQKDMLNASLAVIQGHFNANKSSKVFIGRLPNPTNQKLVSELLSHFKKKDPAKSIYVFAGKDDDDVLYCGLHVGTDALDEGQIDEVISIVNSLVEGTHGGRGSIRNGSGTDPAHADEAVKAVSDFFSKLTL